MSERKDNKRRNFLAASANYPLLPNSTPNSTRISRKFSRSPIRIIPLALPIFRQELDFSYKIKN